METVSSEQSHHLHCGNICILSKRWACVHQHTLSLKVESCSPGGSWLSPGDDAYGTGTHRTEGHTACGHMRSDGAPFCRTSKDFFNRNIKVADICSIYEKPIHLTLQQTISKCFLELDPEKLLCIHKTLNLYFTTPWDLWVHLASVALQLNKRWDFGFYAPLKPWGWATLSQVRLPEPLHPSIQAAFPSIYYSFISPSHYPSLPPFQENCKQAIFPFLLNGGSIYSTIHRFILTLKSLSSHLFLWKERQPAFILNKPWSISLWAWWIQNQWMESWRKKSMSQTFLMCFWRSGHELLSPEAFNLLNQKVVSYYF